MKVKFEVHDTHAALWERDDWRYAIIMGGRGNGRSGTASRYAVSQLLGKEYTRGAMMRAVHSDIRASCWGEINDRVTEQGITDQFRITDNEMFIERGQNSLRAHGFRASSGSLTARLKSLAGYNFIWIEEAEEIGEDEFRTLDDSLRTVKGRIRIVLSLNTPSKNHWLIKRWFDLEPHPEAQGFYTPRLKGSATDAIYIPGTYRENLPNLDLHTVRRYEDYKRSKPAYYWQMIEGLSPDTVMGRIYSGWREVPCVPPEARLIGYGLDFGYDPDPAAVVAIYYHNGGYILDEKLYERKLLDDQLATYLNLYPKAPIIADSAEPKAIAGLQARGLNVIGVEKGQDSVEFGIKHVQSFASRISYTATSRNLKDEYEEYAWKRTKEAVEEEDHLGIEDPKCENHCMSAIRYALVTLVPPTKDDEQYDRLYGMPAVSEPPRTNSNPV